MSFCDFELLLFLQRELLPRRDQHDIAVLAHVEAFRLHDDVERLVPRNVLQAQREAAAHRVARDDVEPGEVGDHLQHRPHLDVLEVERQLVALVALARALHELVRILDDRLHFQDEPVVGLIRRVLPQALGLDDHPRVRALGERVDRDDGCAEILHVEPALEILRQRGLDEVDDERLALLPDVDPGGGIGEVDDDPALAVRAAAEIDVAQRVLRVAGARLGESLHRLLLGVELIALVDESHQHGVALDLCFERLRPVEIEDDTRPVAGLDHVDAAQRDVLDQPLGRAETIAGVDEIESDPRRRRDREARGRIGGRVLQHELDDRPPRRAFRHRHRIDAVGRLRVRRAGAEEREQGQEPRARAAGRSRPGHDVVNENERAHFFRSCVFVSAWISCSVPVRSVQSPLPSCTSSFMRISLSLMPRITPKFCPR